MSESKINSFADACSALNRAAILPDVSMLPAAQGKWLIALVQLDAITEARNNEDQDEAWKPDFENYDQYKFWPVFDFSPGSGWSCHGCDNWDAGTHVGARPFRTREIARQTGEDFKELYIDILNWQNSVV